MTGANKTDANFVATGSSQQAHSVALSWKASTSTVKGYNVYRSTSSSVLGFAKLNAALITSLSYSDPTVVSGTTYYYVATAVDAGGDESVNSNQVVAEIP